MTIDQQAEALALNLESKLVIEAEKRRMNDRYKKFAVSVLLSISGILLLSLNLAGGAGLIERSKKDFKKRLLSHLSLVNRLR